MNTVLPPPGLCVFKQCICQNLAIQFPVGVQISPSSASQGSINSENFSNLLSQGSDNNQPNRQTTFFNEFLVNIK